MEKKDKSFEQSLEELEKLVKELENGDVPLDDAIDKFNEGMRLANLCTKKLEAANDTITKALNKEGNLETFENLE